MTKLNRQITKISASMIFIAAILTSAPSLAENTTLNGVEISSSKDRGYEIVLNTDTATDVQTKEATSDKLVLDLKNTKIAKDANTVYKDADGIENVILKPKANNLEIEINGAEAGESKVSLNSETQPKATKAPKDYSNTVFVNNPLHSYAPVTSEEESGLSLMWLLRSIRHSQTLRSLLSSSNLGWILCFTLMFGFLVVTSFKNRPQKRVSVKISSDENTNTDNTLLKQALARKEGLIAEGLGSQQTQPRIIDNRHKSQPRTIQPQPTAQKQNYGLRAYNNQQLPTNNNGFKIQSTPLQRDVLSAATASNRTPMRGTAATAQQLKEDIRKNEVRIDNIKFLESMAKIYERSGRSDLASGLAKNIQRARKTR